MARTACLLLLLVAVASAQLGISTLKCQKASDGITEYGSAEVMPEIIMPQDESIATIPILYRPCITNGVEVEVCHSSSDGIIIEKVTLKEVVVMRPLCSPPPQYPAIINITTYCLGPVH